MASFLLDDADVAAEVVSDTIAAACFSEGDVDSGNQSRAKLAQSVYRRCVGRLATRERFALTGASTAVDGAERHGVERNGVERHGVERHGVERHGVERHGVERHSVERHSVERHSAVRATGSALAMLSLQHRAAIALILFGGHDLALAATTLNLSPAALVTRLREGLAVITVAAANLTASP